ncbi:hypothetical protein J7E88_27685 [Streptomyces sp. ISL-10]|uniref:hypothetical protein n=1 Tax=Streptomyces sp. ISL-10 TaxID=2819172 RepID=UPI001BEAEE2A|nr:hypothetical protein [Streptomyces sp. ISL-10]MBT2368993.1 hypothetical protein [Streptomyces sp. ISL-10]
MPDPHGPRDGVVALDVGGTGMKGSLLDRTPPGALHSPTPRRARPDAVVQEIAAALREPASQADARQLTVRQAGDGGARQPRRGGRAGGVLGRPRNPVGAGDACVAALAARAARAARAALAPPPHVPPGRPRHRAERR